MTLANYIHKCLSLIILYGLLLNIAPKQFIQGHHEHRVKICHEQEKHFDQAEHECQLCDAIVSSFLTEQGPALVGKISQYLADLSFPYKVFINSSITHSFFLRGPPFCFLSGPSAN